MPAINEPIRAPEFAPGEWLNSAPLRMEEMCGKVVLVDFFDYSCVNCLRTLPYIEAWWERYRELGLQVIGIHTPEFSFGTAQVHVQRAVKRLGIPYPVLLDAGRRNWSAWANRYLPTLYLVDERRYITYFQYGEGAYQMTEAQIQILLGRLHPEAAFPSFLAPLRATDNPGAVCEKATPELYLGYGRGRLGNTEGLVPDTTVTYRLPPLLSPEVPYLEGDWQSGLESATLMSDEGSIVVRYRAKEVHLVLAPPNGGKARVAVEQDDAAVDPNERGADVYAMADIEVIDVTEPRAYQVVNNPTFDEHELRLRLLTPGLAVYSLSFVTDCLTDEDELRHAS